MTGGPRSGVSKVDEAGARAWLVDHHGPLVPVDDVQLLGEGAWSRAFAATVDGQDLVVRFGRFRADFDRDRHAASWAGPDLQIPAVHHVGPAAEGFVAVSDRCHGTPLEQLDADGWAATLPSLLDALAELREIRPELPGHGEWDVTTGGPFHTWGANLRSVADDPAGRRTDGFRAPLEREAPKSVTTFDAAVTRLGRVADAGRDLRHVIHGDLLNANALAAGGRLTGIFDWGCSAFGDPLYDPVSLEFWGPWHPGLATVDVQAVLKADTEARGRTEPDVGDRWLACALHIGIENMAYCASVGRWTDLADTAARIRTYF